MGISFDEVKQMFRDSIDESANINDLLQRVANKIYQKGLNDGIAPIEGTEKRSCENCGRKECSQSIVAIHWDECVESNFTKWWKPKDGEQE